MRRLDRKGAPTFPKTVNDPIWGAIELFPWEILVLDSALLQRLRGIRQLGMACHVYPGGGHSRFEHSLGVLEAADRMIRALQRNAENRREFGPDRDESVPVVMPEDRIAIRLAALLHDVGHGPFSHATELLVRERYSDEFDAIEQVLRQHFLGTSFVSTSEVIAVLIVLSTAFRRVLIHDQFQAKVKPSDFSPAIAARIIGSRSYLKTGYLAGVINGPLDADKLDYMARDSFHSGLPLGLDLNRIINKLEVIVLTPKNAPNPDLRRYAEEADAGRLYETGISAAGIGAYEQMVIARVFLYDRLYYHHKVRAADAMAQRLIHTAEEERGHPFEIAELLSDLPDEAVIDVLGGRLQSTDLGSGGQRAQAIAAAIHRRDFYRRAYVFAERFVGGMEPLSEQEQSETRQIVWDGVRGAVDTQAESDRLALDIYKQACDLAANIPELGVDVTELRPEHVIVDFPLSRKVTVAISDERVGLSDDRILTRSEGGDIDRPNMFFNPERWSKAYQKHKQSGYVFAPYDFRNVVALASQIVFVERFQLIMSDDASKASKTQDLPFGRWIAAAADKGLCSAETAALLTSDNPHFKMFTESDIPAPAAWIVSDPTFRSRIATGFASSLPAGVPAAMYKAVVETLDHLFSYLDAVESVGEFLDRETLSETELQKSLRRHCEARRAKITEASALGGGETDLIFNNLIVVENKVRGITREPLQTGPHYVWQARRYSLALSSNVTVIIIGYKPPDEAALLPQPFRVTVEPVLKAPEPRAQIRLAVPYGCAKPSRAREP